MDGGGNDMAKIKEGDADASPKAEKSAEGFLLMDKATRQADRTLRDYPISLRQSARAVFGDTYARAEKGVAGTPDKDGFLK